MNPTLSIIIPAYNEEKRIGKTLDSVTDFLHSKKIQFEIIVVANNCIDNTVGLLNGIKENKIPELQIINIPKEGKVGNMKGYAISIGMRQARGLFHIFIDADNATDFKNVISFMKEAEQTDGVVIASRYIKGSHIVKKQPLYRIILSRASNLLIRLVLLPGIYDTQCGFKMFSQKASKEVFSRTTVNGWGADLEMLAIARVLGFSIKESPVTWESQDESTVRSHAFFHTLVELFKIRKNVRHNVYK
ncbi:MAG: dolichyl-phosphate beta-glucosyltransferase [bacterium]